MSKTIFRVEKNKDNPFVMIDRRPIENPKISWRAKGILTYLISRPDNWTVRLGDLVKRSTEGSAAIRKAVRELRDAGHIVYNVEREGGRIKQWILQVHEVPILLSDFQQVEKQQVENRTVNDTELKKNNKKREIEIFHALEQLTGGLNSDTPRYVDLWLEKHDNPHILQAIGIAKDNKARSVKYIDEILIGWEAKGYPKTREQKVQERKTNAEHKGIIQQITETIYTAADLAAAERIKARRAGMS